MAQISQRRKRHMQRVKVNDCVNELLVIFKKKKKKADTNFKNAVYKRYGVRLNSTEVYGIKNTINNRFIYSTDHKTDQFNIDRKRHFVQVLKVHGHEMKIYGQFVSQLGDARTTEVFLYTVLSEKDYAFKLLQMPGK